MNKSKDGPARNAALTRRPVSARSAKKRPNTNTGNRAPSKKAAGTIRNLRKQRNQTEALMHGHDARYRTVVNTSKEGFWAVDVDGRLLDVNDAYVQLSGYTREELLTMRVSDLEATESPEDVAAHIEKILARGSDSFETLHWAKGRRAWPVEVTVRYHPDHPGEILCFLRNITERKRAEAQIREREARYRALVETSSDGFWVLNTRGDILEVNDRYLRRSGYSRGELLAMTVFDIDASGKQEELRGNLATQGTRVLQTWHRAKDGTVWPVEVSTVFLPSEPGHRYSFLRDITDRLRAKAELQESREKLRLFIEHAPVALAMFDQEMRYLIANRRWMTDYGLGERDLRGLSYYEVLPKISQRWKEAHRRALKGEILEGSVDSFERAGAPVQWIRWAAHPWHDPQGNIGGIIVFSDDVTEAKRSAELLGAATSQLAVVEERERRAIALDLHDNLSQLLSAALVHMRLAAGSEHGASAQEGIRRAIEAIELADQSARSISFQISPPVLAEAGLVPALESLAEQLRRTHRLSVEINDNGAPKGLSGTVGSVIYRAIRELLINVAKHAEADVARVDLWSDGDVLTAAVVDSGVGFDKHAVEKRATARGFGLATMRERLRLVGGMFDIDTRPGEGTVATIEVPLTPFAIPLE